MGYINARLRRLEERWRVKPVGHFLSVVRYPFDCEDRDRWLREELPCACGAIGCPELAIGMLAPAKAPSDEAWSESVQQYYREKNRSNEP